MFDFFSLLYTHHPFRWSRVFLFLKSACFLMDATWTLLHSFHFSIAELSSYCFRWAKHRDWIGWWCFDSVAFCFIKGYIIALRVILFWFSANSTKKYTRGCIQYYSLVLFIIYVKVINQFLVFCMKFHVAVEPFQQRFYLSLWIETIQTKQILFL